MMLNYGRKPITARKYIIVFFLFGWIISSAEPQTGQDFPGSDIFAVFEKASYAEKADIAEKIDAIKENRILIQKIYEYVFEEKNYSENPYSARLYAAAAKNALSLVLLDQDEAGLFKKDNLTASIGFLSSYGYREGYPVVYRLKSAPLPGDYRKDIQQSAGDALKNYGGNYFDNILAVVKANPPVDVLEILETSENDARLSLVMKGKLFEEALDYSMKYAPRNHVEKTQLEKIQLLSIKNLSYMKWSEAAPLVIRFFNYLSGYKNTAIVKNHIIETVKCLGNMGSAEATERLNLFLVMSNRYAEKNLAYDPDIVFEVVRSLGNTGDIRAFENLSNVRNYPYPEKIIREAEISLSRLRIR